jgi:hypothetical protein
MASASSIEACCSRSLTVGLCVAEIAHRHNKSVPQVVYCFALELGMLPLTGTGPRRPPHLPDGPARGRWYPGRAARRRQCADLLQPAYGDIVIDL